MSTFTPPDDLYWVTLVDGLLASREGKEIRYKRVKLRETSVADERQAIRLAERVVMFQGQPKLMLSDADFRFAMTAQHVDSFHCDGMAIERGVIDLDLVGRLSPHDLGLIESRVFLMTLAAEVRYGNLSEEQFDQAWSGATAPKQAPQPMGQAAVDGAGANRPESGPQVLADFTGTDSARSHAGNAS